MRLYNKRFIRDNTGRQINQSIESRDAVVYSINAATKTAQVKIQGSNQLITVAYPENTEQTPAWLKPGNAVKISHTSGMRGRLEITGNSQYMPTAASYPATPYGSGGGGGTITPPPDPGTPEDAVISGLHMEPYGGLMVHMSDGSARIGGITRSVAAADKTLDAAPAAGLFRYDLLVVGADSSIDIVKGTAASTPVMPSVPSGHVLIGWVLLSANTSTVTYSDIGRLYTAPVASNIGYVFSPYGAAGSSMPSGTTTTGIVCFVLDQYGSRLAGSYSFAVSIPAGMPGNVGSVSPVPAASGGADHATVTYTKGASPWVAPMFNIVESVTGLQIATAQILLDGTAAPGGTNIWTSPGGHSFLVGVDDNGNYTTDPVT